jgi:agmatinase
MNIKLRYANNFTFAKIPFYNEDQENNKKIDIGIIGIPFDSGCSFRTGARFGPSSIRTNSCILREYNIKMDTYPFKKNLVDFGDINVTPFNNNEATIIMENELDNILKKTNKYIILGGDHTISYPSLKAINKKYGKVSIIHFDSHLDTFDDHFGSKITHGTPFKRSVDENLLNENKFHIGLRGSTYSKEDLIHDKNLGFKVYPCDYIDTYSSYTMINEIKEKIKNTNVYISIDIDVIDPAYAPGTGTPEIGGFSSREFLNIIRLLKGLNIVGADIVEVSPSYDTNANITSLLASTICYELLSIM